MVIFSRVLSRVRRSEVVAAIRLPLRAQSSPGLIFLRQRFVSVVQRSTHDVCPHAQACCIFHLSSAATAPENEQVIEFLHRVLDIMGDYFGGTVDESAIKESFSLVYQLLEEMMDNGYPLTTEPNALKAMIRPPTTFVRIVKDITGKVC